MAQGREATATKGHYSFHFIDTLNSFRITGLPRIDCDKCAIALSGDRDRDGRRWGRRGGGMMRGGEGGVLEVVFEDLGCLGHCMKAIRLR